MQPNIVEMKRLGKFDKKLDLVQNEFGKSQNSSCDETYPRKKYFKKKDNSLIEKSFCKLA